MGKLWLAAALVLAACGGGESAPPDALITICGEPGDEGNEIGVGRFCTFLSDCADTPEARLCATLGDPDAHFCTRICQSDDPPDICGTGAECVCEEGGATCGCTPSECL